MSYRRKYKGNQYPHLSKVLVIICFVDCWVDIDYILLVEIFFVLILMRWKWFKEFQLDCSCFKLGSLYFIEHLGFDLSFWSTVVKIYPFTTLKWANECENIYGGPTISPAHRPIYFSDYWKELLSKITVPQAKPASNCLNSTILAIE